jgi:hypothetical protein
MLELIGVREPLDQMSEGRMIFKCNVNEVSDT